MSDNINGIKWDTDEITKSYFAPQAQPEDGVFELALVLGGTVSAGAYTAGVLDFLIEALDTWTALRDKDKDPRAPTHKVVLQVITGTSGGGVNAAIAARALNFQFPPVRHDTPDDVAATNPFYDTWVNRLALDRFLETADLKKPPIPALFNAAPIDAGADAIETFAGQGLRDRSGYCADPLTMILTVTNLRGVPYKTVMGSAQAGSGAPPAETFINHADYGRFAVAYSPAAVAKGARQDEFAVDFQSPDPARNGWSIAGLYARGTSAFPVGFPPRDLSRRALQYSYRVALLPGDGTPQEPDRVVPMVPDWSQIVPAGQTVANTNYLFPVVDGGATDNEPIELARVALAGLGARNPRDGKLAKRAVILIDPFGGGAAMGPQTSSGLFDAIGPLLNGMIEQTRYDSRDILLASREDVFSRFMVSARRRNPKGGTWFGNDALATAPLGAFIGFACAAFRKHDYRLGRRNCQAFLRNVLVLPKGAAAFGKGWANVPNESLFYAREANDSVARDADSNPYLPLIPLLGIVGEQAEPEPHWPKGALQLENLRRGVETRFVALAVALAGTNRCVRAGAWVAAQLFKRLISSWVLAKMKAALTKAGLD